MESEIYSPIKATAPNGGLSPSVPKNPKTTPLASNKHRSNKSKKLSYNDFDFLKVIGKGAFGMVTLVKKKTNGKFYAMKILKKKDFFLNEKSEESIITEKSVLMRSSHPFVVKLHYSFQDNTSVYYCLDYIEGGELFKYLKKKKVFTLWEAKFYAAEVLLALNHLHTDLDTIYRDLKPENILVDSEGHIKLTDFGLSKSRCDLICSRHQDLIHVLWNWRVSCSRDYQE